MSGVPDSNSFQDDDQTSGSESNLPTLNGVNEDSQNSARKQRKKKKKKSMTWTLDDQIKLLETRKEMEDVFASKYQTGDAWLELVQKCGWNIEWEVARNKFMYLKRREGPKKSCLPPTGISGHFLDGSKKSQIYELATYFTLHSHKYHFPKIIDTSASTKTPTNNSEQTSSDSVNEMQENSSNFEAENHENNVPEADFSFLDDRFFEDYNHSDQNSATEKPSQPQSQSPSQPPSQPLSQTTSQPLSETSSQTSKQSREESIDVNSYLYSRKRKRRITQNDIMIKTSDSIEKMANDLSKLTSGTLEYLNFAKEIKLKTYQKKYEMVDLTEEN